MSDIVHYCGRLEEIKPEDNESFDGMCHRILLHEGVIENGDTLDEDCYDSWYEVLEDKLSNYSIIVTSDGWRLFRTKSKREIPCSDSVFNMERKENGEYWYEVLYYNGSCSFSEAIEEAYENMENEER